MRFQGPLNPTFKDLVNQPGGAYAVDTFLSLVRAAVEENWIETGVMTDAKLTTGSSRRALAAAIAVGDSRDPRRTPTAPCTSSTTAPARRIVGT